MEMEIGKIVAANSQWDSSIAESSESLNMQKSTNYNSINNHSTVDLIKDDEKKLPNFYDRHGSCIFKILLIFILIAYFIWATYYQVFNLHVNFEASICDGYGFLVIVYGIILFRISYGYVIRPHLLPHVKQNLWNPLVDGCQNTKNSALVFYIVFFSGFAIFLIIETSNDRYRLISLSGIALFILFGYVVCPFKSQIRWPTLINGMVLQVCLGLLIIKSETGQAILNCVGNKVSTFLGYAVQGAAFVYGDSLVYQQGVFAFKALCVIYFISFCINILYYYGLMQSFVSVVGRFFKFWLGTSICESVNSAANIFLGMCEAPLLLKPFLENLTDSELHNIMCCGFATTSGTVLAAYISFGAKASTLISASVMAAPSALCFSKLMYPETEEPKITEENVHFTSVPYASVLDAASSGASDAVKMVLNIIAGVIACLSFIYFLNGCLTWCGDLVGFTSPNEAWTINLFVGYLFTPVAFLMGVPLEDCGKVGELIALKTTVNEFVAFQHMSKMTLLPKSEIIATFAICGFANPGSVGIMISGLSALIPDKRATITRLVFRAAAGGAVVCFLTACIAGLLIPTHAITTTTT